MFKALISDRLYRKAHPRNRALKIIKKGSGNQFDSQIVSAFLDVIDKINGNK